MREALKLALEALKQIDAAMPFPVAKLAIMEAEKALAQQDVRDEIDRGAKTLRETYLAQPEPPLECQTEAEKTAFAFGWFKAMEAQRTWVGLTDEEIDQGLLRSDYAFKTAEAWRAGVVFAMTKLKEKNNG